jgi:AraC-like DNA-binding protein
MSPELHVLRGEKLEPKQIQSKQFRGTRLPGSILLKTENKSGEIILQELVHPFYIIGCRLFHFIKKMGIAVKEKNPGLRFEAILTGEMEQSSTKEETIKITAGQYQISNTTEFTALFKRNSACTYFITHYSDELLQQTGLNERLQPCSPRRISPEMNELIQDILHNPYEEGLRNFYYENCVRELLFLHLKDRNEPLPGELNDRDVAAIYKADAIIQQHLNQHFSIRKLSLMTGTNEFKLKKGFRKLFSMGVFERLIYRRMFQAKALLESTDKSIEVIGELAGYETTTGFITAFRKRFGKTPLQWRKDKFND